MVSAKLTSVSLSSVTRVLALVILLGVVVYVYLLSSSEGSDGLKETLEGFSVNQLVIPIVLSLISYLLRFVRWRIILKQLGHSISIRNDLIWYLSGFALTMTPGKSGETIRSAFLLQAQVPFRSSLSAFVIERSFDLLIVGLYATLLFIHPIITLLLFLSALIGISLIAHQFTYRKQLVPKAYLPNFLLRLLNVIGQASVTLKPRLVVIYALLGCAAWGAQGVGFYCIVSLFTQEIDISSAISTYCSGIFVGAVSFIPGGLGITEGSLSWLLQTQGLDQNAALLSALISRGCTLWLAVAIGCCALVSIVKSKNTAKQMTSLTTSEID